MISLATVTGEICISLDGKERLADLSRKPERIPMEHAAYRIWGQVLHCRSCIATFRLPQLALRASRRFTARLTVL
jgi:hypothetical protein